MFAGQSFSCGGDPRILHDENISMDSSLSTIDPNTLPIPRYQSTERIISLVTSSLESQPPKGKQSLHDETLKFLTVPLL